MGGSDSAPEAALGGLVWRGVIPPISAIHGHPIQRLGTTGSQALAKKTAARPVPLGSLSGGECDAASALAQLLALLAAVRRAARQRLRASAGDAPLDVAAGDALRSLLVLAAAGGAGAVALAAAALAAVAAALAPLPLALAASALAAVAAALALVTLALAAAALALAAVAVSLGRLTLAWAASALALWAAQRLGGAVRPGLPERLVPRLLFLLGSRRSVAPGRLGASVLAS